MWMAELVGGEWNLHYLDRVNEFWNRSSSGEWERKQVLDQELDFTGLHKMGNKAHVGCIRSS